MAYKQLYVSGFAILNASTQFYRYQLDASQMRLTSSQIYTNYPDDIQFQHELECELDSGYFHIVVKTDRDQIISIDEGCNAEGDGCDWDLTNLSITYGRDPFINNLYGQY